MKSANKYFQRLNYLIILILPSNYKPYKLAKTKKYIQGCFVLTQCFRKKNANYSVALREGLHKNGTKG
jgi:hypothetical protein